MNISIRPSFDENYKNNWQRNASSVRPSYQDRAVVKEEETLNDDFVDDDFDVQRKKYEEIPDATFTLHSLQSIKQAAEKYIGSPYYYGGTTKRGFDCSGFVWRVFQDAGYNTFKRESAEEMFNKGVPVAMSSLKEGDLCFFHSPKNRKKIDHTGIYIGNGKFIHSSSTRGVAYSHISDNYWKDNFVGFRRLLP
ncbi:MAG: C40 family peptidase [Chitinispirillales bacterium]|nr:C40 family peptidase [Chitinispirillales bacterium]